MHTMDIISITLVHVAVVAFSIYWATTRRDEVPALVAVAVTYFGFYRYLAINSGWSDVVDVSQLYGIPAMTPMQLQMALVYMGLGECVLVGAYCATAVTTKVQLPTQFTPAERRLAADLGPAVLTAAWVLLGVSMIATMYVSQAVSGNAVLSLGYGYLTHLSLLKIGAAILLWQIWMAGGVSAAFVPRIAFYMFWPLVFLDSLRPDRRFELLGWALGAVLLWSYGASGRDYLRRIAIAFTGVALVIGATGVLRQELAGDDFTDAVVERISSARDANMLEGFAIVLQVYPDLVPYRMGAGHFEILIRPIPRALWPDKPLGGYSLSSAVGGYDFETLGTTGISPSLFGSFYEEGGVLAVILFAALYGVGLAKFSGWSNRQGRLIGGLIRAALVAGLVPLLRGGDLAGVVAWLGFGFLAIGIFAVVARKRMSAAAARAPQPARRPIL
jgi:hypothetical protein